MALPSPQLDPQEERLLAKRFQEGDRAAFAALCRPHLDTLYTLCLRMTSNVAEAEDVAQEALLRALKQHAAYDATRAFRPWLLAIGANLCRDRLRSAWWRRMLTVASMPHDTSDDVESEYIDRETDVLVRNALASVPTIYREALALYHLHDMSYVEMAAITGAGIPALKQRVRRGTAMLQNAMVRLYPHLTPPRILKDDE